MSSQSTHSHVIIHFLSFSIRNSSGKATIGYHFYVDRNEMQLSKTAINNLMSRGVLFNYIVDIQKAVIEMHPGKKANSFCKY